MSDVVERVRAAIEEAHAKQRFIAVMGGEFGWREIARDAIEAMREPTEAMVKDAQASLTGYPRAEALRAGYTAMIDAALNAKGAARTEAPAA